ncbi:MAG: pyridoxamine 5'-phosphate oxidase family protein [Sulfurovum sp.]|nr:pyridoxamine 5'-phosphate oxidase family protein [Sulfurovum sp.]
MNKNTSLPGCDGEKILQKKFNTIKDALAFYNNQVITHLSELMQTFIQQQEMMFISTSDAKGECDASFRAGEAGFVKVLDRHHIIYPEYKGNGVMASMGNISENANIGLLFLDFFETKVGLHVNGKATIIPKEKLKETLLSFPEGYLELEKNRDRFKIVSYVLIEVEEAYIHCSLHIPVLKKVEPKEYEKKFPKYSKGGDAFCVSSENRPWKKEEN